MVLVIFKAKVVPVEAQLVQTSIWLLLINTINLQFCHLIFMEILISDLIKLDAKSVVFWILQNYGVVPSAIKKWTILI